MQTTTQSVDPIGNIPTITTNAREIKPTPNYADQQVGTMLLIASNGIPFERVGVLAWDAYKVFRVAKIATTGAENAANGLKLSKSLASQAQMGETGTVMAGAETRVPFRDAERIAAEHGGEAADWVKKTSSSYSARDGTTFETHWVENIKTGERVEFKTKFPGGD